ncbi:class C beta-lactamase [Massilia sp. GCM10020059]|uniref:Beta-lactamase n=1 Tax=Massilia agrisoli TaxID=2892444 RepID=A0ABS8IXH6_9BURK|nr:class C beta-lactamase [Massilia agrisoli]MCC6073206.1 beta-lactamase [Massilia agrisoli]
MANCAAIALLCSALLPVTSLAADHTADMRAIVDAAIRPLMAEHDVPGMAVAITIDGKPAFFNYGVASREKQTPVSEKTLFEMGSISKVFTGTLASYAQVLGKLSLDDSPGKYMPQLKGSAIDKASLLHVGTYTAGGLPLQFPDEVSNAGMAAYFQQWKADAAPGTQRRYSNPSLGLFGHLTALALKRDFAELMETQLFPRLGLYNSHIRIPAGAMASYAWGYNRDNKAIRVNPGVFADEAYGVKSSAADMIRFVQVNIDPGQLPGPMQRAVAGTHVGYFKVGEMVQGLGWEQYPYPITVERLLAGNSATMIMDPNPATRLDQPAAPAKGTLFNKTGSTGGFGAYVAFVPAARIGIVMMANKNYPIPSRVKAAHAILAQLAAAAR